MKREIKSRDRRIDDDARAIVDLMKSSGYLFPETDEQMAAYEAGTRLRELPEKFRTPEFVFKAVQMQNR